MKISINTTVKVVDINEDDPPEAYDAAALFLGRVGRVVAVDTKGACGSAPGDPLYTVEFRNHRPGRVREVYWSEELQRRRRTNTKGKP